MPIIYYSHCDPDKYEIKDITKLPDIRRIEHLLGRKLLKEGLKKLYGITPAQKWRKDQDDAAWIERLLSYTKNGKPYLKDHLDIFFNISHSGGLVACAFDHHPVGVDVGYPRRFSAALLDRIFTENEKNLLSSQGSQDSLKEEWFCRLWTLKESYVKLTGEGIAADLKAFSFSYDIDSTPYKIRCQDAKISCFQQKLNSGHILSLCYIPDQNPIIDIKKID